MKVNNEWTDYSVLATGDGEKLERWGKYVLLRPDPQVIWPQAFPLKDYKGLTAYYTRSETGGGAWHYNQKMPSDFTYGVGGGFGGGIAKASKAGSILSIPGAKTY